MPDQEKKPYAAPTLSQFKAGPDIDDARKLEGAIRRSCPFCSAELFHSRQTGTVHHTAPACEGWLDFVAQQNPKGE